MLSIPLHDALPLLAVWSIVVGVFGYAVGFGDGLGHKRPAHGDRRLRERRPIQS